MNKIAIGWLDDKVVIRVVGKGEFLNSRHLKVVVTELLCEGYKDVVVDLAQCRVMDSTFIGVLTGLTLRMSTMDKKNIMLANMSKNNREVLETLGVLRFFQTIDEPLSFSTPFEPVEDIPQDPNEAINQVKHILEAHQNLINVHKDNVKRFKAVKETLEKDLSDKLKKKKNKN